MMQQQFEPIPAIDLIEGKCVRLTQGEYDSKKVYGDNPVDMAKRFEDLGFKRLHVVDLDGAKSKHVVNVGVLEEMAKVTRLEIDFGGGIKSDEDIRNVFGHGAKWATIGSIAVTDPEKFDAWLECYGAESLILGADVKNGLISINGWKEESRQDLYGFLDAYTKKGVTHVLCTDISRDGMLQGPAIELYGEIMKRYPHLQLIASGGVSCMEDLKALYRRGVPSAVFGKAIYEGRMSLKEIVNEFIEGKL